MQPALLSSSATATTLTSASATPTAPIGTPTCQPGFAVVPSPNGGPGDNIIYSVAILGSDDIWAVGASGISGFTEHWNGAQWSVVPNPPSSYMLGVSGTATDDVWAVGISATGSPYQTLTQHWDGASWQTIPSPNVGPGDNKLNAVIALEASNAWAVGNSTDASGSTYNLVEHWNGQQWSVVASPDVQALYNQLYAVSAHGPDDIWAVGATGTATTRSRRWPNIGTAHRGRLLRPPARGKLSTDLQG